MYYKFNETNNITGFIKELLKDFNLPSYRVYREGLPLDEGRFYIWKTGIYQCIKGKLVKINEYMEGKKFLNVTTNFKINSSTYDSYTHEYLGNYLRFLRDYKQVDLMPLYNCFSGVQPLGLNYKIALDDGTKFSINIGDDHYNYYIVPVKFNEEYTIAIDSPVSYDICTFIYTGDDLTEDDIELVKTSHTSISNSLFNNPFIYSTYNLGNKFWQKESELKLLLKLPKVVNSSIVILEGNYTNNSSVCCGVSTPLKYYFDKDGAEDGIEINSKLSLLRTNDTVSYPFADRLVEYLLGNAITRLDKIENNIGRIQKLLYNDTFKGYYDIWDKNIKLGIYDKINTEIKTNPAKINIVENTQAEESSNKSTLNFTADDLIYDHYYREMGGSDSTLIEASVPNTYYAAIDLIDISTANSGEFYYSPIKAPNNKDIIFYCYAYSQDKIKIDTICSDASSGETFDIPEGTKYIGIYFMLLSSIQNYISVLTSIELKLMASTSAPGYKSYSDQFEDLNYKKLRFIDTKEDILLNIDKDIEELLETTEE